MAKPRGNAWADRIADRQRGIALCHARVSTILSAWLLAYCSGASVLSALGASVSLMVNAAINRKLGASAHRPDLNPGTPK
ncbi:MAG: hypothetical protein IPJ49_20160 [Candidatus Obscuribacter sp.]|nr:hypothetical protein [Candidatus Obscuribacter sp.]